MRMTSCPTIAAAIVAEGVLVQDAAKCSGDAQRWVACSHAFKFEIARWARRK